jgi:hypothetical protein
MIILWPLISINFLVPTCFRNLLINDIEIGLDLLYYFEAAAKLLDTPSVSGYEAHT